MADASAPQAPPAASGRRRTVFLALVGLLGLTWALPLFGLPSLILGWFEGGERLSHRVHDLGYGAWGGILVSVGYLSQLRSPERRVAGLQQAALSLAGLAVAVVLSADVGLTLGIVVGFGIVTVVLGVLHPARDHLVRTPTRPNLPMVALAIVAAVPLTLYAVEMAELQRTGVPADPHVAERHWSTMAALALSIWLVALLAAFRTPGWRIPAWSAGLAAAVFGLASVVFPGYPGSVGSSWGLVTLAGGALFVGLAEWVHRREPARQPAALG